VVGHVDAEVPVELPGLVRALHPARRGVAARDDRLGRERARGPLRVHLGADDAGDVVLHAHALDDLERAPRGTHHEVAVERQAPRLAEDRQRVEREDRTPAAREHALPRERARVSLDPPALAAALHDQRARTDRDGEAGGLERGRGLELDRDPRRAREQYAEQRLVVQGGRRSRGRGGV
jgi:hypothetical protein